MSGSIRRGKWQRNHRRNVFVFAVLFFVFQMTVMPQSEAYSTQEADVTYIDSGINGLLVEDKQEEEKASSDEEEQEEFTEEQNVEKTKDIDESASDDPDTPEMDDRENLRDEEDKSLDVEENDVYELTEMADEYTAVLCFDAGIPFPEGSTFSVSILTEEEETYPEYCRLLSETMDAEEELIGFYIFTWEIPDTACSEEEMFLTLLLKDIEDTERTSRAYYYDDEPFAPAENIEVEENTFYFMPARQGLYALTAADKEEDQSPPKEENDQDAPCLTELQVRNSMNLAGENNTAEEEKNTATTLEEEEKKEAAPLKMMATSLATAEENMKPDSLFRSELASAMVTQRNIYRLHLSAEGLSDEVHHVEINIMDQQGNIRDTLTLSAENAWTADWEADDNGDSSFIAVESGIYDSSGKDLTEEWECSVLTSDEQTSVNPHDGWMEADSMDSLGTYVIAFESGGEQYLLAVASPDALQTASSVQFMNLSVEKNSPENASYKARWVVAGIYSAGIRIRNAAVINCNAYLTTRKIAKVITFALIRDDFNNLSQYENHHLTTNDNVYLRVTPDTISSVKSADQASYLTLYQPVNFYDIIQEKTIYFRHTEKPAPVQHTTVRIKLMVGGNMGERDRSFSFHATVNNGDAVSFTLARSEDFVLEEIPVGAKLTVNMEAPDYMLTSSFGDSVEGERSLTILSMPEEGGTIVFRAIREGVLNTGIKPAGRDGYTAVLVAVFSGFVLRPFFSIMIQSQIIPNIKRRKNHP